MDRISIERLVAVIIIAVCLALFFFKWFRARKKKDDQDGGLRDTCIMEGMSLGLAAGALVAFTVYKESGVLLLGMMLGMAVGMFIPKKK